MAEDNEWHTVTSHKVTHAHPQAPASSQSSNMRRKSKHKINVTKQQNPQQKQTTASKPHRDNKKQPHSHSSSQQRRHHHTNQQTSRNPFHAADDDDSEEEEEENDEQIDPIDLPVPPYHTTIVIFCPFQGCDSPVPFVDTTSLVKHLKEDHQIVFKNLHHMYMALDTYLSRWAKEFQQKPMNDFAELDNNVYTIDPEKCTLDKDIREDMQRAKLNEVLKTQQDERENDSKIARKCLFCKIIGENRTTLFKHMFSEHNFNIGLPDNLVYVNEFLDTLEGKLSRLQCLYCEKTFTSPAVLRKHMRKKKHFKIASKNRQYDRFYVINYLEPGKNWENFEKDTYESDDDKQDDSWADWEEDVQESTMCLFDTQVLPSPKEALEHMKQTHHFDLTEIRKSKDLDFYQVIVLINYIRHQSSISTCFSCEKTFDSELELTDHYSHGNCISKFIAMDASFWKDPRFLIPTYENDPLLTGFEEENEEDDDDLELSETEANKKYHHQAMESLEK